MKRWISAAAVLVLLLTACGQNRETGPDTVETLSVRLADTGYLHLAAEEIR